MLTHALRNNIKATYNDVPKFQVWKPAIEMQINEDDRKKAVMRALLDDHSRLILTSTMLVPKSVIDITHKQKIPITSAYRKVKELKEFGLLKVDRIVLTTGWQEIRACEEHDKNGQRSI